MKYFLAKDIVYFWISQPDDIYTKITNKNTFARSQHGYLTWDSRSDLLSKFPGHQITKSWVAHQGKDHIALLWFFLFLTEKAAADHSHVDGSALSAFVPERNWCPGLHPEAHL